MIKSAEMKILMLNYEYPPLGGGTGIANQYLLREFGKDKNVVIHLVTSSVDKYKVKKLSKKNRVFYLDIGKKNKNLHHQTSLNLLKYFLKSTVWAVKNRNKYDLVHAFGGMPAGVTAWLTGKPYMISLRGGDQPNYEPRFNLAWRFLKPLAGFAYSRTKSIDANSQYLKNLTLKSFPHLKIKVIRNGVDKKLFYPAKKQVKKPIILCVSRLGKRKGVEHLIKAMPDLIKVIPRVRLWLAGDGKEKAKLKKLVRQLKINQAVKFWGKVEHDKLGKIYRQARIFVLPSLSESTSNSLLEAMACGLPVVATNVGGNSELLGNDQLVGPSDDKILARTMDRILRRSKVEKRQIKSWERTASQYLKIYDQLGKLDYE